MFSKLTAPKIKDELRRRKLPLSGRKLNLIARLEANDERKLQQSMSLMSISKKSKSLTNEQVERLPSLVKKILKDIRGVTNQPKLSTLQQKLKLLEQRAKSQRAKREKKYSSKLKNGVMVDARPRVLPKVMTKADQRLVFAIRRARQSKKEFFPKAENKNIEERKNNSMNKNSSKSKNNSNNNSSKSVSLESQSSNSKSSSRSNMNDKNNSIKSDASKNSSSSLSAASNMSVEEIVVKPKVKAVSEANKRKQIKHLLSTGYYNITNNTVEQQISKKFYKTKNPKTPSKIISEFKSKGKKISRPSEQASKIMKNSKKDLMYISKLKKKVKNEVEQHTRKNPNKLIFQKNIAVMVPPNKRYTKLINMNQILPMRR